MFFVQRVLPVCSCRLLHRVPIDEEWKKGAAKELKGKDVDETLIWKTAEVSIFFLLFLVLLL